MPVVGCRSPALLRAVAILLLAGLATQTPSARQPAAGDGGARLDPLILAGLKWRSVGPAPGTQPRIGDATRGRGGRSIAVSGVKGRPDEAYFGAAGGGLWKTTDGGDDLVAGHRRPGHSSSVGAVAVSETNPDIVYIGMGESCIRGNIMPGDGVYKSTDARQDLDARRLRRLAGHLEDPHPPDQPRHRLRRRVRQATARPATSAASSRRTDGGKTWQAHALPRREDRRASTSRSTRTTRTSCSPRCGRRIRLEYTDVERRPGQRAVQVHRRRRDLDGDHAQPRPAARRRRQDRRRRLRRRLQPRLRDRRERERRPLPLRRRAARRGRW